MQPVVDVGGGVLQREFGVWVEELEDAVEEKGGDIGAGGVEAFYHLLILILLNETILSPIKVV